MLEKHKETMLAIIEQENLELKPELANQIDPTLLAARKNFLSNSVTKIDDPDICCIAQRLFGNKIHLNIFAITFHNMPKTLQELDTPITPKEYAIARIREWKKVGNCLNRGWHRYLNRYPEADPFQVTQAYCLIIYLHVACFWPLKKHFESEKEMHEIYFEKNS